MSGPKHSLDMCNNKCLEFIDRFELDAGLYSIQSAWIVIKVLGWDSQKVLSLGNFFAKINLKVMTFVLAKISLKLGFTKSA